MSIKRISSKRGRRGELDNDQLTRAMDLVPHVTWLAGPDGQLEFVSDRWEQDFGGDRNQLLADGWLSLVHPDDRERARSGWEEARAKRHQYCTEFRVKLPNQDYAAVAIRAKPDLDAEGAITRWIGTCTDISERVVAHETLEESESLYRGVLEASADCIKVMDLTGRLQLMNTPGLGIMEVESFEAVQGEEWASLWPEEMQEAVRGAISSAAKGEVVRFSGPCPTAKGTPKYWDVVVSPMTGDDGQARRLLVISRDVTVQRQKAEELHWTSEHDVLTGLPNRRAFQNRLHAATLRAMSSGGKLGLLLIDLDHFKHVNDSLGHPVGDALLQEFGTRLKGCVRNTDFVARVGGDEFAVIMEDVSGGNELVRIGENITSRLKSPVNILGRVLSGGASIGAALFPDDAKTANDLFKLADTALYSLKASGRGGTKLFKAFMREDAQRVASQLSLARVALSEERVRPFYQPKVDLESGQIKGFEALLRWQHPTRGVQLPETIHEAFEDYELASKIGHLMQTKVLADIRAWSTAGFAFGRISINASPAEFLRNDFAERLLERVRAHDVPPSSLQVEITEHGLMDRGAEFVARALRVLKSNDIQIALDDFGTGYSSLSHLRDYPVDVVKIDKSFIAQLGKDSEADAIVAAVTHLCKGLNIEVVAEGVETSGQADLLRLAGCKLGQGYRFGRPEEADVTARSFGKRLAA